MMKENVAEVSGMKSFWYQINDYFEQHPYQEVFIPAIVGSILGITIEYLVNGDFLIENIWTFLFLNLGFLYQAYRKQKRTKEKKNNHLFDSKKTSYRSPLLRFLSSYHMSSQF